MQRKINPSEHKITFNVDETLHITLTMDRLIVRSIQPQDEKDCIKLLSDPKVMKKFATGVPLDEKTIKNYLGIWIKRWGSHDPFSGYAVCDKKSNEFIGIFGLGHSSSGVSEISCAIHSQHWNKGYMKEAASAFRSLIPRIMLREYTLNRKPLKKLIATARLDNPGSQKLLTSAGFKTEKIIERYGAQRYFYSFFAKSLRNQYQNYFTQQDRALHQKDCAAMMDTDVDITLEQMAKSAFGRKVS